VLEGFRVFVNLAQLRSADPGKGLARRSADDDVHGRSDRAQVQLFRQVFRMSDGDVARPAVLRSAIVKVDSLRTRRVRFELDCRPELEACRLKAQRQSSASGKQVQQSRTPPRRQARHFQADRVPRHHVAAFSEARRVSSSPA
jgi:hypothetical protein